MLSVTRTPYTRLRVEGLTVIRGDRLVLEGVSFELDDGEALLLTGPNGAGKSTLLRTLAGLRSPDEGIIRWEGEVVSDPALHATRLAYLGHMDALKPGLTLTENLALYARLSGLHVTDALERVDLLALADLPARFLSAGQRRRAAIARVLLAGARLWLLDEPSVGLDSAATLTLGAILKEHQATGGLIVVTTHVPLPLDAARSLVLTPPHLSFTEEEGDAA